MRIAVIGGGIVGVATSHRLLDDGHDVTIIDPSGFAEGASRGNAGWIAHLDVLPLASPKAWRQLPRWLADPLGPLAIRPSYSLKIAPWMLRFLLASQRARVRSATSVITSLNREALPAWEDLLAANGLSHLLRRSGFLSVWDNPGEFEHSVATLDYQRERGIPLEVLSSAGVRDLEPELSDRVIGGVFYETGCHVSDPYVLTTNLAQRAVARGAKLVRASVTRLAPREQGIGIDGESLDPGPFDRVVVAAGAWSGKISRTLGDRIPLDTERGYNATYAPGSFGLTRPVVFEGHGFVTTPLDTGDRIGGSVEFAGLDAAPNYRRINALVERFRQFVPSASLDEGIRWMGFRPSLPDSIPAISKSLIDSRVVYAFGHGHYGLTQAAITARKVRDLISDVPESPLMKSLSIKRYLSW